MSDTKRYVTGKLAKEDVYKSTSPARMAATVLNHRQRYATQDELDWLRGIASVLPGDALAIIIGAGPGVMLAALKDGNPAINVFMVDIDTCDYAIQHMSEFGPEYQQDVFGMIGDSSAVGTRYTGRYANILIIDGDHSELGVQADIVCWLSHVHPGGYIFVHDYDAVGTWFEAQEQYPGVKVAADRLLRNYKKVGQIGTAMVYINEVQYE